MTGRASTEHQFANCHTAHGVGSDARHKHAKPNDTVRPSHRLINTCRLRTKDSREHKEHPVHVTSPKSHISRAPKTLPPAPRPGRVRPESHDSRLTYRPTFSLPARSTRLSFPVLSSSSPSTVFSFMCTVTEKTVCERLSARNGYSVTAASPQRHNDVITASQRCHHSVTAASPQRHNDVITASQRRHHSVITASS